MGEADALTAAGVAALNRADAAGASQSFLGAIRADRHQEQAWLGLTLALALQGNLGDVVGLLAYRERVAGDGFLFAHGAIGMLAGYRLHAQIRALAGLLPETSPFHLPALYHAGCAALLAGDEDDAFDAFARFKAVARPQAAALPIGPDSPFNIAWRQAMLIEDHAYIDALDEAAPPPALEFADAPRGSGGAVLAAACDARYFRLFAPGFVRSAAAAGAAGTLHLHVIAPDAETHALAALLATEAPALAVNLSTEPAGRHRSGAYYASSRFLIAPVLLQRYGGRLILADLDVEFTRPLADLIDATSGAGFAGFRHDGPGPCSRWPAVLTLWDRAAGADLLLDRIARFIRSKLDIEWPFNWMLDQAALGSVRRWAQKRHPEIALAVANEATGRGWQSWLNSVGGAEKADLIRAAGLASIRFPDP